LSLADVVLDTDAASLIQRDRAPAWFDAHLSGARVWLTFVAVGELTKWAEVRGWGPARRTALEAWVDHRSLIPYDGQIARTWGELAGAAQRRGRPRPQNDTWVAACCLRYRVPLLTMNTRDFNDFAAFHGLELLKEP
jgi:predicted nucleic acid-binding protein